jgi:hypothetical protein
MNERVHHGACEFPDLAQIDEEIQHTAPKKPNHD